MKYKKSVGSLIFDISNHLLMIFIILIMIYPMLHVIALSLSEPGAIVSGQVGWFPVGFNTNGYKLILSNEDLLISYKNTILYAGVGTFLTLLLTSLIAYPLSIKEFVFKRAITFYLAVTMFFSGGLIPTFLLIRDIGLYNTFWVMVLPGCVSAFNVIMFRTFFQNIPIEMRESAFIDGANEFVILFRIILPLSQALLAVFALFTVVGHWNNWFPALIYLKDTELHPVQMLLRKLLVQEEFQGSIKNAQIFDQIMKGIISPKNVQMAIIFITMAPILCVYPFVQKYFVKGVMVGSLKG